MGKPLHKVLHPYDETKIMNAIVSAERMCSGEFAVHVEGRCPERDPIKRAEKLMTKLGITRTRERNAVLFYVATHERRGAILGDTGINEDPKSEFFSEAFQRMQIGLRRGAIGDAVVAAIQSIAVRMQGRFPRQADDKNEIDNEISTDPSCV